MEIACKRVLVLSRSTLASYLDIAHLQWNLHLLPRLKRRQPEVRTTPTPERVPSVTAPTTRRLDRRLQFLPLGPDLFDAGGSVLDG